MPSNPFTGAAYLMRGLGLLNRPGVRRFVAIPLTINIVLFALLLWLAATQFGGLIEWLLPTLPDWMPDWLLEVLSWLLWLLFALSAVVLLFFGFTLLANLVAAPFNGFLAEAVERDLTGREPPGSGRGVMAEVGVAVSGELAKLGYFASRGLPLLLLFMIPGLNLVAPVLWLLFGAWMLALEYADFPMGNYGLSFRQQRDKAREKRLLMLGFGGAVTVGTMVPLFNFIIMPAAVAGATALWVEQFRAQAPGSLRDQAPNQPR